MREMPHEQWVAFDGFDSVHSCDQSSEYEPLSSESSQRRISDPSAALSPMRTSSPTQEPEPPMTPRAKEGMPAWLDTLLGLILVLILLLLFSLFSKK